jgi:hypothetical protein
MPSIANSEIVDATSRSANVIGFGGGCRVYSAGSVRSTHAASAMIASIGRSLSAVVTTCTPPPERAPLRLIATNSQIIASAGIAGGTPLSAGITAPR